MRAAVLSSATPHSNVLLMTLLQNREAGEGEASPSPEVLSPLLGLAVARRDQGVFQAITQSIAVPAGKGGQYAPWQFRAMAALLEASDHSGGMPAFDFDKPFAGVWPAARRAIADETADPPGRSADAALLGYRAVRDTEVRDLLVGLLRPQVSVALQQAAVAALGKLTDPKLPDLLVHDWRTHSPQVRNAILDAAFLSRNRLDVVVAFLARGQVCAALRNRSNP